MATTDFFEVNTTVSSFNIIITTADTATYKQKITRKNNVNMKDMTC